MLSVGPLFWYDLARLARRNRTILLRFVYGCFLLTWLYFVFNDRFPGYLSTNMLFKEGPRLFPRDLAQFALSVVAGVVTVQGAAVFIVTPAYLAHAIAEERELGTLDLLLASPLSDREIILGKLFGRLAHMGMILLTGLPILALVRLWGGVDGAVMLAGFVITGLAMLSVGSICILCSVLAPNVVMAVVSSYVFVAVLAFLTLACPAASPLTFLTEFNRAYFAALDEWRQSAAGAVPAGMPPGITTVAAPIAPPDSIVILLQMLIPPLGLHGLVFLFCTVVSIGAVRGMKPELERASVAVLERADEEDGSWGPYEDYEIPIGRAPRVIDHYRKPVCDPPLLWKEVYHGGLAPLGPLLPNWRRSDWIGVLLLILPIVGFFALMHWLFPEEMSVAVKGLNVLLRVFTIIFAGVWCVCLGFRAAISVCGERQQKTLEGLFLLPLERREILWAKWLGSILRLRHFGYCLVFTWLAGLVTGALHPWAVLLLAAGCSVYLAFLASLGICLSLVNRNMLWANLSMALVILLLVTVSALGEGRYQLNPWGSFAQEDWKRAVFDAGFNPVRTLWLSGFTWKELVYRVRHSDPLLGGTYSSILLGLSVLAVIAWLLWQVACFGFNREPERRRN